MIGPETMELRPGHHISRVIRGGWQLAGDHGDVDRPAAIADMEAFLDAGIVTFDCADIYTGVEQMIGDFISNLRHQCGAEKANRVVVHTKLVPDLSRLEHLRQDEVEAIIDRSLKRLQIERLDLVQFFWWDLNLGHAAEALDILRDCQKKGKILNLGTTNWDSEQIKNFTQTGYDIASAQVQYSVLDRRPSFGLAKWAAEHDIHLLCYGTLAGGFLTEDWLNKPDPGFKFTNRSLVKYRLIIDEFGSWDVFQGLLTTLKRIGDKHRVSLSSVATRWVLDQPQVAGAIVGARYAHHLPKTLQVFDVRLDSEDHAKIKAAQALARGPFGPVFSLEGDRTSRHGSIMKYNLNTYPEDQILAKIND